MSIKNMKSQLDKWLNQLYPWFLDHGIKIIFIVLCAFILNKILYKFITRAVRVALNPDRFTSKQAEKQREDTLIHIFCSTGKVTIWIIAILTILQESGVAIGPILAAAGIVGLAFGFGGQYLIRDIISGMFIILENQYRIGDVVSVDNTGGLVEGISLRMTTLRDLDGTVHHIPHGEIKKVSNLSKLFARVNLNIGIAYDSNLENVIQIINEVGLKLSEDPKWKESIIAPPQFLRIDDFGDSAIILKVLGETKPLMQWDVTGEFRKRIKMAFDENGIEIPFPQRVVHHVNTNSQVPT